MAKGWIFPCLYYTGSLEKNSIMQWLRNLCTYLGVSSIEYNETYL